MRGRYVALAALLLGTWLVLPVSAQNYLWSTLNGRPFAPGLVVDNGTAAAPSMRYRGDTNTGWFLNSDDDLRLSVGGSERLLVSSSAIYPNLSILYNSDNTYDFGADNANRANDVILAGRLSVNNRATVTVDGATTFAITSSYTVLACTGTESINTITGGITGAVLYLENSDTECTIVDDDSATASNAVDLTGAATDDVGAVAKVITLIYNGTHWLQVAESDN